MSVHQADPPTQELPRALLRARAGVRVAQQDDAGLFLSADRRTQAQKTLVTARDTFRVLAGTALLGEVRRVIGRSVDELTVTVSTHAGAGPVIESVAGGSRRRNIAGLHGDRLADALAEFGDAWTGCTATITLTR